MRPIANSNESPGKKGVITKPVSQKITVNSKRYVQLPSILMYVLMNWSRCKIICSKAESVSMRNI